MSFHEKVGDCEISGDFSQLEKLISELDKSRYVDAGIIGENSETVEGGLTLAGIGAVHEFGTDKAGRSKTTVIPERSFIRMPIETGQSEIEDFVSVDYEKNIKEANIEAIFTDIGLGAEARIQEAFDTGGFGTWEPLKESTIKRKKGSEAILIDQGPLRQGITSKVGGGK